MDHAHEADANDADANHDASPLKSKMMPRIKHGLNTELRVKNGFSFPCFVRVLSVAILIDVVCVQSVAILFEVVLVLEQIGVVHELVEVERAFHFGFEEFDADLQLA